MRKITKLRNRARVPLTTRERQIVLVLSEGATNREIGRRLRYSEGPPEPYLSEAGHPQPNHARRTGTHESQNPSCGLAEMQAPALVVAFTCAPPRRAALVAQLKRFRGI